MTFVDPDVESSNTDEFGVTEIPSAEANEPDLPLSVVDDHEQWRDGGPKAQFVEGDDETPR